MYAYDGRGSLHRNNNNNSGNNKPHGYSYNQNRRRHGHGHGHRSHNQNQNQNHGHGHNNGPAPKETPEPARPQNAHADKLLTLLKTSGEYDRLRKLLFTTFQNSVSSLGVYIINITTKYLKDMRKVLLSRVDGVVTECLENDRQLLSRPPDLTNQDLMRELDTYPFVERQVLCVPIWRDDEWISQIEHSIYNLIHDRAVHAPAPSQLPQPPPFPPPSALLRRPPAAALLRNQTSAQAPWRVPETAPLYIPEEMDQGLGEDDMAIDDD